jgi:hypothetical protein
MTVNAVRAQPSRVLQFGWEDSTVRWCDRPNVAAANIVASDLNARTPRERAAMLRRIGIRHLIWDWRDQDALQFDAELDALHNQGITLGGIRIPHPMPGTVSPHVREFVTEAARRGLAPDLWLAVASEQVGTAGEHIWRAADHVEPLAQLAADHGMCVLLANETGFFAEPRNLVALVEALAERGRGNVGIAYQQQHGHAHIADFARHLEVMQPHLVAIALNGMDPNAEETGRVILPYGAGRADRKIAHIIAASGWQGQLVVQGHSRDDAELRLLDNLEGLDWVIARQDGRRHHRPTPRIPAPVWPPDVPVQTRPIKREAVSVQAPDPYSAATHALLTHLEAVGFRGAPRSFGWDTEGRHLVEWVEGLRADHPLAPDDALDPERVGVFMREMHDALASFVPPAGVQWFEGLAGPGADMIIHQDISPSNILVTPEGRLIAIDWDAAAPGTRLWDIAQAAHAFAPLCKGGLDAAAAADRLARFAEGYGLTQEQRLELLPLLAARSERMYEYLDAMRITGQSPWIELWERGVGIVWKSDAQWIRENEPHWRGALLAA